MLLLSIFSCFFKKETAVAPPAFAPGGFLLIQKTLGELSDGQVVYYGHHFCTVKKTFAGCRLYWHRENKVDAAPDTCGPTVDQLDLVQVVYENDPDGKPRA